MCHRRWLKTCREWVREYIWVGSIFSSSLHRTCSRRYGYRQINMTFKWTNTSRLNSEKTLYQPYVTISVLRQRFHRIFDFSFTVILGKPSYTTRSQSSHSLNNLHYECFLSSSSSFVQIRPFRNPVLRLDCLRTGCFSPSRSRFWRTISLERTCLYEDVSI